MDQINTHIEENISNLSGPWISKKDKYEKEACDQLGFTCKLSRYWDATFNTKDNEHYIEIKKGKSIWLNEVRYSETLLANHPDIHNLLKKKEHNEQCKKHTITIFIIPSKNKQSIQKNLM